MLVWCLPIRNSTLLQLLCWLTHYIQYLLIIGILFNLEGWLEQVHCDARSAPSVRDALLSATCRTGPSHWDSLKKNSSLRVPD